MHPGMIGGIVGGIVGLAGGIIGTYFSIKNAKGPGERAFMIRASVMGWVAIAIFLGFLFALPSPYKWFMWVPYSIFLPVAIVYGNKKMQNIRRKESRNNRDGK